MNIGLRKESYEEIVSILNKILATTYAIYLKTQNYHWNITGREFFSHHILLEKQYEEMAEAVDEIAERTRSLGKCSPGSFSVFGRLSEVEEENENPPAIEMLKRLTKDHEKLIIYMRENSVKIEGFNDGATADLINKRLAAHSKMAWMLRSSV